VAGWRELKPLGGGDSSVVRDESNNFHAFYTRESLIHEFVDDPCGYLREAKDPEATDSPNADGPDVIEARKFVAKGV
jgi:hypothetical protein